jgi:Ca-activated chloride channel family protein
MTIKPRYTLFLFSILILLINTYQSNAQLTTQQKQSLNESLDQEKTTRILFILDASASMLDSWSDSKDVLATTANKWTIAKKALSEILDTLKRKPNVELGLRVYGFQSSTVKKDCDDTKLCVPFGIGNVGYIKEFIKTVQPNGITPIAISLEQCVNDFPKDLNARNAIILITDGEESCNGDPCAMSILLQKNNIVLKPFVIGMNIDEKLNAKFECMGNYINPQEPEDFRKALTVIAQTILSPATVQVNLLDALNKPSETDVDMSFYDTGTGFVKYNLYHTITYRGNSDTINIDPVTSYTIQVHTIPPLEKKDVKVLKDENTVVNIPAPQGFLEIKLSGATINNNLNNKLKCLIRQHDIYGTLNVQDINSKEKYITGKYDLEFLTLPRTIIPNISIDQSKTTTIEIQRPGILNLNKSTAGFGGIFVIENSQWKKIYDLAETMGTETVALQPGTYKIIYRSKLAKKTSESLEKNVIIISGGSVSEKL